jgi:hypothetical protein
MLSAQNDPRRQLLSDGRDDSCRNRANPKRVRATLPHGPTRARRACELLKTDGGDGVEGEAEDVLLTVVVPPHRPDAAQPAVDGVCLLVF